MKRQLFEMNWNNESIIMFLRLYKRHPCIWNPKHENNKERNRVNEAWADIQDSMPMPCTIPQLKKKKESLMSAYRGYKTKIRNTLDENGQPTYYPCWFAFKIMDSFLGSVYVPHGGQVPLSEEEADTNQTHEYITDDMESGSDITGNDLLQGTSDSNTEAPAKRPKKGRYDSYTVERSRDFDESEVMTRIWSRKLRKLPEDRRDYLIYKINNLIYDEVQNVFGNTSEEPPTAHVTIWTDEVKTEMSD